MFSTISRVCSKLCDLSHYSSEALLSQSGTVLREYFAQSLQFY